MKPKYLITQIRRCLRTCAPLQAYYVANSRADQSDAYCSQRDRMNQRSNASRQMRCHLFHGEYYLSVLTLSFEAERKSCFTILRRVMKLEAGFATYSLGELSPVSGVQPTLDSVPSGFVENIRLSFTPQRRHRRFS
jgi:hypothetical protein